MRPIAFLVVLLLVSPAPHSFSQSLDDVTVTWETRYDNIDTGRDASRIQAALRIRPGIAFGDHLSLQTLVSTGVDYTSRWGTLHDYRDPDAPATFPLNLRHLYLQYESDRIRWQLGAIPSVKGFVSSTSLAGNGWIDGTRVEVRFPQGILELAGGSLKDFRMPNLFERTFVANYFESELSVRLHPHLTAEASYEHVDRINYGRAELRWTAVEDRLVLAGEILYAVDPSAPKYGFTLETDLLAWFSEDLRRIVTLWLFQAYVDEEIGVRGVLADDFYTFGHSLTLELEGAIRPVNGLGWFLKGHVASPNRFNAGLVFRLP